jgi:uncharacterized protein (TIGR02594 family)
MTEPSWIIAARGLIGTREIPGPASNSTIVAWWAKLHAPWFNNDGVPWCGLFVAHCLDAVGLPYPGKGAFARALRWATWGMPVSARLGAIGVKSRKGGGHVFFIVGETADKRFFKALGGNQGDRVSIVDVRKSDVIAIRWPQGAVPGAAVLPVMPVGAVSGKEA